ncbi:MAG: hypothetical protein ABIQ90_12200 [Polaromonas sp.]
MSSLPEPPLYVPTLTEVVHPVPAASGPALSGQVKSARISVETQDLLVQRLMQRIDLTLEQRLHEAIEKLIAEHTKALIPRLREEIELVVRESVSQAFDQESASYQICLAN